jgi:hypothetical protein
LFYPLNYSDRPKDLCGDAESRREPLLVKTDNQIVADKDDGHAHLTRLLNHFLALLEIMRDIVFGIVDALILQKILCHLAEVTGRRAVNGDSFIHIVLVIG